MLWMLDAARELTSFCPCSAGNPPPAAPSRRAGIWTGAQHRRRGNSDRPLTEQRARRTGIDHVGTGRQAERYLPKSDL